MAEKHSPKIRVAITGGGIAGATLHHALLPYTHLDVHIFEAAPAFRERGYSIGIWGNGMSAFELIGASAAKCLEDANPFLMDGMTIQMAVGKEKGSVVGEVGHKGRGFLRNVGRASLLHQLIATVPPERTHASKKLVRVREREDSSLELHFEDGTTHICDILVGADGIQGMVRRLILGDDDPAAFPYNRGWLLAAAVRPFAEAAPLLRIADKEQHIWVGDNAFLMYSVFDGGDQVVFCLASGVENAGDERSRYVTAEEIRQVYREWPPHLIEAIEQMILVEPEVFAFYSWEHSIPARTYTSGPMCVIGDAAHATGPWLGAGGGMCIEDVLILSTLLGRTRTVTDAVEGLKVYDEVRRPHTQRVVEASRRTGYMMTGRGEDTGLDPDLLREGFAPNWDFIHDLDVARHRDEALEKLEQRLAPGATALEHRTKEGRSERTTGVSCVVLSSL